MRIFPVHLRWLALIGLVLASFSSACGPQGTDVDASGDAPTSGGAPAIADVEALDGELSLRRAGDTPCGAIERILLAKTGAPIGLVRLWNDANSLFVETFALAGWHLLNVYLYASPEPMPAGLSSVLFPFVDAPMALVERSLFQIGLQEEGLALGETLHVSVRAVATRADAVEIEPVGARSFPLEARTPSPGAQPFAYVLCRQRAPVST